MRFPTLVLGFVALLAVPVLLVNQTWSGHLSAAAAKDAADQPAKTAAKSKQARKPPKKAPARKKEQSA